MRSPFALRFRLSSLALAAALLFALAGLFAIDRSLAQYGRTQVELEAVEAAALVEGFLTVHGEALQSVRGLYLGGDRAPSAADVASLLRSLADYAPSFRRVWITDSTGQRLHEYVARTGVAHPGNADEDSVPLPGLQRLAARARLTRRAQLSGATRLPSGERGFVMLAPLITDGRLLGFAGGTITSAALLDAIRARQPATRRNRIAILVGRDTIATDAMRLRGPADSATVALPVPGGGVWRVAVVHDRENPTQRVVLWAVGLATLAALVVSLFHERRQGHRLAERSAELERLSTELLRANRAKSEFLANISHELRTPLNAIVGFADLLRDDVYGELTPRQVVPVERIASSANHLRHLVDQVLDIAKLAAGRFEVHAQAVDLRPFVLEVASEVESLASERGLNLSIAVAAGLPRVQTDPVHLRQILVNLIANAIKFTPTGGVAVRARLVGRGGERLRTTPPPALPGALHGVRPAWIALQVADSGIGISPADRERIFDEFEQVNPGSRGDSQRRGTGLGLAISRRLARLLGGDITVESERGKGSTFTVWLPVEQPPEAAAQQTAPAGEGAGRLPAAVAPEERAHPTEEPR